VNAPGELVREEIEGFFAGRRLDDLLVLYLSCHGVKDASGRLYFAAMTTKLSRLAASGISSDFVYEQVERCRARKILLLLDCCYSGAYLKGHRARAADRANIRALDGTGRAVITSSTALEYAFEIDTGEVTGTAAPSIFTAILVEGLRSGDADRDGDGLVSVDDLYGYVHDRVREATPNQTPEKKWGDLRGDFIIAKNPHAPMAQREALPARLSEALQSPFSSVRETAIRELAALAFGIRPGLALTAREKLQSLAGDDRLQVSTAAMAALFEPAPRREDTSRPNARAGITAPGSQPATRDKNPQPAADRPGKPADSQPASPVSRAQGQQAIEEPRATGKAPTRPPRRDRLWERVRATFREWHDTPGSRHVPQPPAGENPLSPQTAMPRAGDRTSRPRKLWHGRLRASLIVLILLAATSHIGRKPTRTTTHGRPSPAATPTIPSAMAGSWAGTIRQHSVTGTFTVNAKLALTRSSRSGTVDYSGPFTCSDRLRLVSSSGTTLIMDQQIIQGPCQNGTVTLRKDTNNTMTFTFRGVGAPPATGTLTKQP
jgi:hypothetical protein